MNKRRGYRSEIILTAACVLLILATAALAMVLLRQHRQFQAEREQWAKKEKKYEKQLKKQKSETAEPVEIGGAAEDGSAPLDPGNMYNIPAGTVLEPDAVDMGNLSQYFTAYPIEKEDPVYNRIHGNSYVDNENIGLEDLSYMKMLHYNFQGEIQVGELIMAKELSEDILEIFRKLFENEYQIASMCLVDNYWTGDGIASDSRSIDENNTSAFNYRPSTANTAELSNHAWGRAIDINPIQNPYIEYDENGAALWSPRDPQYDNRELKMDHMISDDDDDLCYKLFTEHGFTWGGDWINPKDYQHFEKRK